MLVVVLEDEKLFGVWQSFFVVVMRLEMNWVNWRMLFVRDIVVRVFMGNYWLWFWGINEGFLCFCEKVMRFLFFIGKGGGVVFFLLMLCVYVVQLGGQVGIRQVQVGFDFQVKLYLMEFWIYYDIFVGSVQSIIIGFVFFGLFIYRCGCLLGS